MKATVQKDGKFVNVVIESGNSIHHIYRFEQENTALMVAHNINKAINAKPDPTIPMRRYGSVGGV